MTTIAAAIATNRFGLGAKPGELQAAARDPRGWLSAQLRADAFQVRAAGLPTTAATVQSFAAYRGDGAARADARAAPLENRLALLREILVQEGTARFNHGLATQTPYAERLALFWTNHFTVAATKAQTIAFAGVFEREAIRANLNGRFEDVLIASTRHIGMLLYLDQAQSIGPNSRAARRPDRGLNENLAREILELQTLGAQGGYTQADVTEFARALTGWTVVGARTERLAPGRPHGSFLFAPVLHEPGARTVLGKRYPEGGEEQGLAILRDLARHPATARRIATKLAAHLTQDAPRADAIAQLERVFRDSGGDLPSLHRAAIALDDAWTPEPRKFKTPNDYMTSALRLIGLNDIEPRAINAGYTLLGQPAFRAPSPEGWPDTAQDWAAPDALMKRLEWATALADRLPAQFRPEDLAAQALGEALSPRTRESIRRAESARQGLALALMSPEFQRR